MDVWNLQPKFLLQLQELQWILKRHYLAYWFRYSSFFWLISDELKNNNFTALLRLLFISNLHTTHAPVTKGKRMDSANVWAYFLSRCSVLALTVTLHLLPRRSVLIFKKSKPGLLWRNCTWMGYSSMSFGVFQICYRLIIIRTHYVTGVDSYSR